MTTFNGVKVFTASVHAGRQGLGRAITAWLDDARRHRPAFQLVDVVVRQSSDDEYHCITAVIFFREDSSIKKVRV